MRSPFPFLLLLFVTCGCGQTTRNSEAPLREVTSENQNNLSLLVSIHLIDRNGIVETIKTKERLQVFQNVDFLLPQPYRKVLRVYERNAQGKSLSIITSYHDNGEVKQYLEAINGRACGRYQEWHPNGEKKLLASVIEGKADLDETAKISWVFDKTAFVWSEEGVREAKLVYEKGALNGESLFFDQAGLLFEKRPYVHDEIDGKRVFFSPKGKEIAATLYKRGKRDGTSFRYWNEEQLCFQETWKNDLLIDGQYYYPGGEKAAEIINGTGKQCIFDDAGPIEFREYKNGSQEGLVQIINQDNLVTHIFHIKNGQKHGVEIFYFEKPLLQSSDEDEQIKPKLSIDWYEGKIQGLVKTWYPNGNQESQKEVSQNKNHGMLSVWYIDGSLMLLEEYEHDILKKGNYLKKNEVMPVSRVIKGNGVATIYNAQGDFIQSISYKNGQPE